MSDLTLHLNGSGVNVCTKNPQLIDFKTTRTKNHQKHQAYISWWYTNIPSSSWNCRRLEEEANQARRVGDMLGRMKSFHSYSYYTQHDMIIEISFTVPSYIKLKNPPETAAPYIRQSGPIHTLYIQQTSGQPRRCRVVGLNSAGVKGKGGSW